MILADEPTSMLDVSVRIGVLNLMRRLRDERGISMLYITHDLASARYVADTDDGHVRRRARRERRRPSALMAEPAHPYTQLLLSAVPDPLRAGSYDPDERARLRAAVLDAESCPFDGDPNQAVQPHRTRPARRRAGRRTGTGSAATCTGPPRTSPRAPWPWTRSRASHRRRRTPIRSPPNL